MFSLFAQYNERNVCCELISSSMLTTVSARGSVRPMLFDYFELVAFSKSRARDSTTRSAFSVCPSVFSSIGLSVYPSVRQTLFFRRIFSDIALLLTDPAQMHGLLFFSLPLPTRT